jgi:hypothetical protein
MATRGSPERDHRVLELPRDGRGRTCDARGRCVEPGAAGAKTPVRPAVAAARVSRLEPHRHRCRDCRLDHDRGRSTALHRLRVTANHGQRIVDRCRGSGRFARRICNRVSWSSEPVRSTCCA